MVLVGRNGEEHETLRLWFSLNISIGEVDSASSFISDLSTSISSDWSMPLPSYLKKRKYTVYRCTVGVYVGVSLVIAKYSLYSSTHKHNHPTYT